MTTKTLVLMCGRLGFHSIQPSPMQAVDSGPCKTFVFFCTNLLLVVHFDFTWQQAAQFLETLDLFIELWHFVKFLYMVLCFL